MRLQFNIFHPDAILPTQRSGDVGFDVYAIEDAVIYMGQTARIRTGIALASDPPTLVLMGPAPHRVHAHVSTFLKVEGRSSLASQGIFPVGGIIDPSYRGELEIMLMNLGKHPKHEVRKGDRIAQLLLYPALTAANGVSVVQTDVSEPTERGANGWGSTGA